MIEVFTNLFHNAIEAMPGGGQLSVKLFDTKRSIMIEIRDTGTVMDKKQLKRIFDPFYTIWTAGRGKAQRYISNFPKNAI